MPAAGAQRAFLTGGHHPLAGPSPLANGLICWPAAAPPAALLVPCFASKAAPELLPDGAAQGSGTAARLPRLGGRPPPRLIINPRAL